MKYIDAEDILKVISYHIPLLQDSIVVYQMSVSQSHDDSKWSLLLLEAENIY